MASGLNPLIEEYGRPSVSARLKRAATEGSQSPHRGIRPSEVAMVRAQVDAARSQSPHRGIRPSENIGLACQLRCVRSQSPHRGIRPSEGIGGPAGVCGESVSIPSSRNTAVRVRRHKGQRTRPRGLNPLIEEYGRPRGKLVRLEIESLLRLNPLIEEYGRPRRSSRSWRRRRCASQSPHRGIRPSEAIGGMTTVAAPVSLNPLIEEYGRPRENEDCGDMSRGGVSIPSSRNTAVRADPRIVARRAECASQSPHRGIRPSEIRGD